MLRENPRVQLTCLPAARVAAFTEATVGLRCVAGVPEAQVTAETLQQLHVLLQLILFLT